MASCPHENNRQNLLPFRQAAYNFEPGAVQRALQALMHPHAKVQLAHPMGTTQGPQAFYTTALAPLYAAIPDLERRDTIVIAGATESGSHWVGCCGYYTGVLLQPWFDIPPTGHQIAMRFHEFYRFENNQVVEVQALWDIAEVMLQANAWPMAPALGREWQVPGPATQDGIRQGASDPQQSASARQLVHNMCDALGNFASGGVAAMQLEHYWHPRCNWYGPAGIGTGRGIAGFRNWHQIPFLNGLPDRVGDAGAGNLFADGDYVGFTAWPGMHMTISGDGWLGIAPSNQQISMRSLDFWRCENGMIRENWVLIDLLDVYRQIGVDVLGRMREFTKARALCS